jgi:hypothetical protein
MLRMIVLLRIEAPRTRVRDIYTEKATTAIAPWIESDAAP